MASTAYISKQKPKNVNASWLRNRKLRTTNHKQPTRLVPNNAYTVVSQRIALLCFFLFSIKVFPQAPVVGALLATFGLLLPDFNGLLIK